jgi:hypothetical protein
VWDEKQENGTENWVTKQERLAGVAYYRRLSKDETSLNKGNKTINRDRQIVSFG